MCVFVRLCGLISSDDGSVLLLSTSRTPRADDTDFFLSSENRAPFLIGCLLRAQVVKLGMLKDLGAKIPQLLAVLCEGGQARYGSVANSLIAVNERVLFLGRLCKASKYPPGYVCFT